jgi:hypothetical protein
LLIAEQPRRNAALEQKIESLVNLLSTAQGITSTSDQLTPPESQQSSEPSPNSSIQQPDVVVTTPKGLSWAEAGQSCRSAWGFDQRNPSLSVDVPSQLFGSIPNLLHDSRSNSRHLLQVYDSKRLLNVYREQFAPHFPFINIPDGVSTEDLCNQKPWLFRSIMMVAAQEERTRQQEMGKQIVSEMALAMLLRGEKSLDMLQSLCVCNLWSVINLGLYGKKVD